MKFVTFGEIMLRLTPPLYYRFRQTETFGATYAGAEANVAVSLALFGEQVSFVTKLPDNDIAHSAADALAHYRVDVSDIVIGGERLGLYYYEKGLSQRAGRVIYDRKHSAISEAVPSDFDWEKIFGGAGWYHYSGITPALSDTAKEVTAISVREAKKRGLIVSCDLNYRATLWTKEDAQKTMQALSYDTDVMITNMDQVADVLNLKPAEHLNPESDDAYLDLSRQIRAIYGCRTIAYTVRESYSASHNAISGVLYDVETDNVVRSRSYDITQIADRLGGGDSFTAGLIYCLAHGCELQETVEFATAAECIKHTVEGDFNITGVEEIRLLMNSDGTARIKR